MQDLSTGELVPLDAAFFQGVIEMENPLEKFRSEPDEERMQKYRDQIQRAKDAAIPVRENQGPVFEIGEELEIRGGRFRVHAISGKRLYLDSMPRTSA